jgi:signal peptidase II
VTSPGPGRRLRTVLALSAVVIAADQGAKLWALSRLADHAVIALPGGFFSLRLVANPGAAFSVGSGSTWIFTLFAAAAVIAIPWVAARTRNRSRSQAIALGLVLGGAAANLADRLLRAPGFGAGRVVDFIDYNGWFTGNVADIALAAGCGVLIVRSMTASSRGHQPLTARPEEAGHP